jgi:hypothetical protein
VGARSHRRARGGAQTQGLRRSRPHPRRAAREGHRSRGQQQGDDLAARVVREPLAESAPLASRLAPRLCADCAWFHGLWQELRLRGLNTTPEHHAAFFRRWIRRAGRAPSILISGTADYSLLAQIRPALQRGARITVLDRCATPLELNRWYARRQGIRIATKRIDILDYRPRRRFDVICTHSFLGQFPPRRRARLIAHWYAMLEPGGLVLTINRLRPGAPPGRLGFSQAQAASFEALLGERHRGAARRYARRMGAWPIRSEAELAGLFKRAGFEVAALTAHSLVLQGKRLSAPTTPGGASYACIAARRP